MSRGSWEAGPTKTAHGCGGSPCGEGQWPRAPASSAGRRSLRHRDRKEHLEAGTPRGAAWGGAQRWRAGPLRSQASSRGPLLTREAQQSFPQRCLPERARSGSWSLWLLCHEGSVVGGLCHCGQASPPGLCNPDWVLAGGQGGQHHGGCRRAAGLGTSFSSSLVM